MRVPDAWNPADGNAFFGPWLSEEGAFAMFTVKTLIAGLALGAVVVPASAPAQFLDFALASQRAEQIRRGNCATNEVNPMQRCSKAKRHVARHHHHVRRHRR